MRIKPGGIARAQRLRKAQTLSEKKLWKALRALKINFRRQVPVGPYIADFAHHESKLIIEVDGYHHTTQEGLQRDVARDAWLVAEGFRVLRFAEARVGADTYSVVDQIVAAAASPPSPTLPPSRGKGE